MGSKKLKRKKLLTKKLEKFRKLKDIKRNKNVFLNSHKENNSEENSREKNTDNRSNQEKYYRSSIRDKDITNVEYFSKIRDDYFSHLQVVVRDNCVFYDSVITEEMLENLVLELEQNALLACLQVDIYQKSMLKIISDIKKSTKEKEIHKDVRKLLPHSVQEQVDQIKLAQSSTDIPEIEIYNRIPTVASTRISDNLESKENFWRKQFNSNSASQYVIAANYQEAHAENQNDLQDTLFTHSWNEDEASSLHDQSNYLTDRVPQTNESFLKDTQNAIAIRTSILQSNHSNSENNILFSNPNHSKEKFEKVDPLLVSRNQLQKSVEQTLNESEKLQKQKRDEQERAFLAQILEGDDSLDDRLNDSLSDNENDSKENLNEPNLMNRLEKMRELFGVEDEEDKNDTVLEKQKKSHKADHINIRSRRSNIWRYEKFIQLHKYSRIAAEMTFERQNISQKFFLELFGEDSDEEHEVEYSSAEKYISSCRERISSWVVKYLMPYYHKKRILGRNVFKSLGHYISGAIVDKIQYPDEWTVKYFVSKFFPPKKKYICETDILNFQLD